VSALVGGAIFNLANLLLVAAIDMAGLAVAFPVSIGIALVVGVVLNYVLQPKGNAWLLMSGVACALIAVIFDGKAYARLPRLGESSSRKSIVLCIVSGVLMGLWSPFLTYAMTRGQSLTPYSAATFLTLGALLSCFLWNVYFMKKPLVGKPVGFGGFFRAPASGHLLGLLGGFIWGTGTVFNLVAGKTTTFAVSYAIGQSAPMVAALWGLLMFVFYILAILLVARANG
jgi:glucose uptake protein